MKFTFETKTKKTPKDIWEHYADINIWFSWEDNLEEINLDGEFETGTLGSMTLKGMPPLSFTLTEVTPNKSFTNKTVIDGKGELSFSHELEIVNGETIVKHSVEFTSKDGIENVQDSFFVAKVFSDVPASVFKLIEVANDSI